MAKNVAKIVIDCILIDQVDGIIPCAWTGLAPFRNLILCYCVLSSL